jgi:hypothetical protein
VIFKVSEMLKHVSWYQMNPQNNIAGNRSFDKISLKSFKIHNGFLLMTDLAEFSSSFQLSKDDFIPKGFLSLQNVLAACLPMC